MTNARLPLAAVALLMTACEPAPPAALVVDGQPCIDGALPANFSGLVVGAPFDHAFRVTDDLGGVVELEAAFVDGSDASMRLLRAPFAAEGAVVVPFRVQPTAPGRSAGTLELTPGGEPALAPCRVAVTATAG
jgi:hypothetical protein